MQVGHQVAHMLTTTILPEALETFSASPSIETVPILTFDFESMDSWPQLEIVNATNANRIANERARDFNLNSFGREWTSIQFP